MTAYERRKLRKKMKAILSEQIGCARSMCELRAANRAYEAVMKAIKEQPSRSAGA
jgi:hypothetical protein